MTETDTRQTGVRTVLHVDSDADVRRTLASYLDGSDDIEIIGVGDGQRAIERLDATIDVVVTDTDVGGVSWDRFVRAVPDDHPIILYTDDDPTVIPDEILTSADSLVERGGSQHQEFLVRKIRGIADGQSATRPGRQADAATLARQRTDGLATFLVDGSKVVWASRPFDAVFPGTETPEAADFYERLSAVLADQPAAVSEIRELRDSDTVREGVLLPISLQTGGRRDVLHCSYPLPDRIGATRLELFEDLTVGRERSDRLQLFETLVMGAQDGLYTLDTNGTIDFCNPAMAEQLGYDRKELLGMHASEVMAEGELEYGQQVIQDLIDDPDRQSTVYDMVFVTSDGERRDVSLHVQLLPGPDDSYAGLVGVMRDVTARKERKRELERFETIIQALGDPVYATDGEGTLIYVNEAFERKTGYSASEVIGRDGWFVLDDDGEETMEAVVSRLIESDRTTDTVELTVVTANGDRFPAEVHTALLPSEDGHYSGNAGVVRDITERKRREERLEEFTSVVAHDLRSPLAVGQGNLELYRQSGDEQRLENVEGALAEMERLIDDLLELARHGDVIGETEAVDLDATARDAWQQLQTPDATLVCDCSTTIQADRGRLRQAFENLFRNAVEHGSTSPGSQTRQDAVEHGDEGVRISVEDLPDGFAIADDGPGIPPERRDSVFERGYTTADDGTGFGLPIVEEIVDAHGWDIRVTESDSGGARFEITGVDVE